MINPICNKCKKELEDFGGLAISPMDNPSGIVYKYHLCKDCWKAFMYWLDDESSEGC